MARILRIESTLVALLLGLCAFIFAAPASAQFHASDDREELIISTTTTSSAVVVGAIMLTVVSVKKQPRTALRQYLRENEVAFRVTLATGAGPALRDLADFVSIAEEDLGAFGRLVRQERIALKRHAFASPDIDAFIRHLTLALGVDPALRPSSS